MISTILLLVLAATDTEGPPVERAIRVAVPNHDAVYTLARLPGLTITDAADRYVDAYGDDAAIARVQGLGYRVTVLAKDYRELTADLVDYHTYAQVCSVMTAQALAHPDICRLETLGYSAGNRPIPAMKVASNPQVESDRPCVRIIGAHHGNEKISTEV
ncbi:MAG: M14 family zinc carboxypeptidase, partial [candidate division WOR-3 bacterium]